VNKVFIWTWFECMNQITKFEGNDTFSMVTMYGKHFQLLTGFFSYSLNFFFQLQLQLFHSFYLQLQLTDLLSSVITPFQLQYS